MDDPVQWRNEFEAATGDAKRGEPRRHFYAHDPATPAAGCAHRVPMTGPERSWLGERCGQPPGSRVHLSPQRDVLASAEAG